MHVWINGPFGIGKTATARALRGLLRAEGVAARIYDPELVGYLLQRAVPAALRAADFRAQAGWQAGTHTALRLLAGTWIVPMAVHDPDQLEALVRGIDARIFQLTAPAAIVEARIRSRGHAVGWCVEQLGAWPGDPRLGAPIATEERTPRQVAEAIRAHLAWPG